MGGFALLALAILCLWLGGDPRTSARARYLWLVPFGGWLGLALADGVLAPVALAWISAWAVACAALAFLPPNRRRWRMTAIVAVLGLGAALMSHALPGFHNPRVLDRIVLSEGAVPFSLHLNADKPLVGLFLLGWVHARLTRARDWRIMLRRAAPGAAATILVLLVLSLAAGYVRPDPKLPAVAGRWLGVNLLFTCVAEEAFFRAFVQGQLHQAWRARPQGAAAALGTAAVLFGLAHVGGGWTYVALATVAGVGYGWVYQRTGRIEASILTHFALNAVHFLGFTYPALAR